MTDSVKSARQAALEVLARAGQPLNAAEIARRVSNVKGVALRGKTPDATVTAMLARENQKPDGLIIRVAPGTYALRADVRPRLERPKRTKP